MISVIAVMLGGDARALTVARKINHMALWFTPFEVRRMMRSVDTQIEALAGLIRRAA